MNCTQCKGYRLAPVSIDEGLVAAACPKCEGVLLPLINYRYWIDQNIDVDKGDLDDVVVEDVGKAKLCPKCSRLMTKFQIGAESNNKIELCSYCDEVWLDKGEWQLLKSQDNHTKLPSIFTDAWQRNIRIEKQKENLKEHYRQQLSPDDFDKLDVFKEWLDQHPNKHQLRQYLITNFE